MDYSLDSLTEIERYAQEMMTPSMISALMGIDEQTMCDDIATMGHPARVAYMRGIAATTLELRRTLHDTALAGSPYSVQECQRLLQQAHMTIKA